MRTTAVETNIIKDAVQIACRAPSLHNSQPWQWVFNRGQLRLFLDPSRVMDTDHSAREALISCGAALDHLRVAMAAAGWQSHIDRFPEPKSANHLASIDFTPRDFVTERDRRLAGAIEARRTHDNRKRRRNRCQSHVDLQPLKTPQPPGRHGPSFGP